MANLLDFLSKSVTPNEEWVTLFVPISSKEIPRTELDAIVRGWFQPELAWVDAFYELEDAIQSQSQWLSCERFPYTEALRVIVELQVPHWMVFNYGSLAKVNLAESIGWIQLVNIFVTAKYVAGFTCNENELEPGDLPYDGSIHEIIPWYPS